MEERNGQLYDLIGFTNTPLRVLQHKGNRKMVELSWARVDSEQDFSIYTRTAHYFNNSRDYKEYAIEYYCKDPNNFVTAVRTTDLQSGNTLTHYFIQLVGDEGSKFVNSSAKKKTALFDFVTREIKCPISNLFAIFSVFCCKADLVRNLQILKLTRLLLQKGSQFNQLIQQSISLQLMKRKKCQQQLALFNKKMSQFSFEMSLSQAKLIKKTLTDLLLSLKTSQRQFNSFLRLKQKWLFKRDILITRCYFQAKKALALKKVDLLFLIKCNIVLQSGIDFLYLHYGDHNAILFKLLLQNAATLLKNITHKASVKVLHSASAQAFNILAKYLKHKVFFLLVDNLFTRHSYFKLQFKKQQYQSQFRQLYDLLQSISQDISKRLQIIQLNQFAVLDNEIQKLPHLKLKCQEAEVTHRSKAVQFGPRQKSKHRSQNKIYLSQFLKDPAPFYKNTPVQLQQGPRPRLVIPYLRPSFKPETTRYEQVYDYKRINSNRLSKKSVVIKLPKQKHSLTTLLQ